MAFLTLVYSGLKGALLVALKWGVAVNEGQFLQNNGPARKVHEKSFFNEPVNQLEL